MIATASDLGIGQYTVMRLINSDHSEWPAHVSQSIGALLPLAIAAGVFVFLAIDGTSETYKLAMASMLTIRILTIPFAAVLNALNQFKIRKAIDLVSYCLAALGIVIIVWSEREIELALLTLNATFVVGAILTVLAAAKFHPVRASISTSAIRPSLRVLRGAMPFMANNLTTLLTYGGFIWLCSLALPKADVAKLAVLHSFALVNLYQFYDVFLKARQADLADPEKVGPYRKLNALVLAATPVLFIIAGRDVLALIGNPVIIDTTTTVLFSLFMASELGNLYAQSIVQVKNSLVDRLKVYSIIRLGMLPVFLLIGNITSANDYRLYALIVLLSLLSIASYLYLAHWSTSSVARQTEV